MFATMLMDDDLAILARQKGVAGATRIGHYRQHIVKFDYDDILTWFRNEGVFISSFYKVNGNYGAISMDMHTREHMYESEGENYHSALNKLITHMLNELPDKPGVKMK